MKMTAIQIKVECQTQVKGTARTLKEKISTISMTDTRIEGWSKISFNVG